MIEGSTYNLRIKQINKVMIIYFDINTEQICKFFFNLSANYKSYYLHNYLKDYIKYQKQQNTRNMKDVWKYLYWSVHDNI